MLVTGSQIIKFLSQPIPHFFREDLFVQKLFEYCFFSEVGNQIDRITGQFGFNNKKASVDGTINTDKKGKGHTSIFSYIFLFWYC